MGKGALRPFFKGHSLKKEKEHEKKEVDKMLSHFVTLSFSYVPVRSHNFVQTGRTDALVFFYDAG
mgnify:CR=1 FL=1